MSGMAYHQDKSVFDVEKQGNMRSLLSSSMLLEYSYVITMTRRRCEDCGAVLLSLQKYKDHRMKVVLTPDGTFTRGCVQISIVESASLTTLLMHHLLAGCIKKSCPHKHEQELFRHEDIRVSGASSSKCFCGVSI